MLWLGMVATIAITAVSVDGGAPLAALAPEMRLPPQADAGARDFDWLALPFGNYDSDDGVGVGAAAQAQWLGEIPPYGLEVAGQVFFTTGGVQSHWLKLDSPRFLGLHLRVWANVEYHRELFEPYYTPGNSHDPPGAPAPGAPPLAPLTIRPTNPANTMFAYERTMPLGRVGMAIPVVEPYVHVFTFFRYEDVRVNPYAGSLLAQEQPYGIAGGHELQGEIGFDVDTRDNEDVPTRGFLIEGSARAVTSRVASAYTYWGLNLRLMYFRTLLPWLVLATRLEPDYLSSGTPFYDLIDFGGTDALEGIGGQSSARGIPKSFYQGRGKLLADGELRFSLFKVTVFKTTIDLGGAAFLDLGRAWQFDGTDGPWWEIHPGYGVGLRAWRHSFVVRVDFASSPERVFNAYVLFGHFF